VALERENESLQDELAALKIETERLQGIEAENARLRSLLAFTASKSPKPLAAEVVAWLPSTLEQTITIARGSRDGVVRNQVVRTAEGLLGKITDVGPVSSRVRLLTDSDSGVGVTVSNGKAYGILRGAEEGRDRLNRRHVLELIHLDKDTSIAPGDPVLTSGQGGIFPPGIPVGTIESLREDSTHLMKVARVKPRSPMPGMIREVLILPSRAPEPEHP
jgi:rod shape-determining protein MreC